MSGVNAAVVAEEEVIAGEVDGEMIGTEIMVAGDLIADDTRDHHADVIPEIEDRSAPLLLENPIAMFPVAVVDVDETIAGDHLRQSHLLLRLSGRNRNHVHHLLAVEIGQLQSLARQHLDDADLGLQMDVALHIGEEEVEAEEEVPIVELVEDHPVLHLPTLAPHDHPSEEDPLHLHP